MKKEITLRLFL